MSAIVRYPNGKEKSVKNLGWLLRNWGNVNNFVFQLTGDSSGLLVARMKNGLIYSTEFASFWVFMGWVDRPVFRDVPLQINVIKMARHIHM